MKRAALALAAARVRRELAAIELRDVLCFGGLGCVAYGLAQVYVPAAWIVPGVALFWLGVKR